MKVPVQDLSGKAKGELEVSFPLVENGRGTQAVHDVVVAFRAAQRAGTACTKTVGEVAGSNKKPWRQKGTGRARAGSFASPLWPGGGVVFGPRPRSYQKKVSRQTRKLALQKAISERLTSGDVVVVEDLQLESPRTKGFADLLKRLKLDKTVLVVVPEPTENLRLASRNLKQVELATSEGLHTYQALRSDKLLFTREGFNRLEERLKD